jgi:hypothetical protein
MQTERGGHSTTAMYIGCTMYNADNTRCTMHNAHDTCLVSNANVSLERASIKSLVAQLTTMRNCRKDECNAGMTTNQTSRHTLPTPAPYNGLPTHAKRRLIVSLFRVLTLPHQPSTHTHLVCARWPESQNILDPLERSNRWTCLLHHSASKFHNF